MAAPRLVATGLWLTATVASTLVVWRATSTVAEVVTDRAPPVVEHREVVSQLESASPDAQASTTTSPRRGGGPSATAPASPLDASPPPPSTPTVTPQPAGAQPVATTQPASPPPTVASSPPTTRPASESPSRATATFSTSGGVVRAACESFFFIQLISATPADGYGVLVVSGGPATVEVHFVRPGQDLSVKAFCFGQPIRYYGETPETRPRG